MLSSFVSKVIEKFIFQPDHINYGNSPNEKGFKYEDVSIKLSRHTILHGWYVQSTRQPSSHIILHFHGNAANITNHFSLVDWIPENGFDLITFDYRGYGKSRGKPSLSGVYKDCVSMLDYAGSISNKIKKPIIYLAQSLGGVFAIKLASEYKSFQPESIVLDSVFDSFRAIGDLMTDGVPSIIRNTVLPYIDDSWSPINYIENVNCPKLFLHGKFDTIIPFDRGRSLYKAAKKPKEFLDVPAGTHISSLGERREKYVQKIVNFIHKNTVDYHNRG
jgi:fermentation-respiration switch protein FrsA (DUF1100 family)